MWTANRLELENSDVQLFCRASGVPHPQITWLDGQGNELDQTNPQKYQVIIDFTNILLLISKYMLHLPPPPVVPTLPSIKPLIHTLYLK